MKATLRPLLTLFVVFSLVTGLVYPFVVREVGALMFPRQAAGSLVLREGSTVGSELISQSFQEPRYFWGRLSATSPMPDNAAGSGGSNFSPTNPALIDAVKQRVDALRAADPANRAPIPVDLVTASGSGLDPHISPAAAFYQVSRIARERHMSADQVRRLVASHVEGPQWGVFGEARVNVLMLNLALDRAT